MYRARTTPPFRDLDNQTGIGVGRPWAPWPGQCQGVVPECTGTRSFQPLPISFLSPAGLSLLGCKARLSKDTTVTAVAAVTVSSWLACSDAHGHSGIHANSRTVNILSTIDVVSRGDGPAITHPPAQVQWRVIAIATKRCHHRPRPANRISCTGHLCQAPRLVWLTLRAAAQDPLCC